MSYVTSTKKNTFMFLFIIGLINTILAIVVFFYMKNEQNKFLYESKLNIAKLELEKTKQYLNKELSHYKLILDTLKKNANLNRFLNKDKNTYDSLVENFIDFTKANKNIFQLRYLDSSGIEIVRIDKDDKNQVFAAKVFQDKSSRYYFQKTKKLKDGKFYISDFDLNVESKKIEIPHKPTIRIASPVFLNEKFKGILIINFHAHDLIEQIKNKKDFNVYFMDDSKNFLLHPNYEKSWSTQLKTNYKVKDEIENISILIENQEKGKKIKDHNWKFYLDKINITDKSFYIIYSLKEEIFKKYMQEVTKNILMFFGSIFILSLPFVFLGAYLQSIKMRILENLINNIPFPICLKNNNGIFLIVNDALVKLYDCSSKSQLVGKNSYDFENKNLPYSFKNRDKEVIQKEKLEFEDIVILKNNKKIYYDTKILKLSFLGFLNKSYILGVAIDITAMKILNKELKSRVNEEVKKRLQTQNLLTEKAKLAEMGNMIDNIIHQWKQPLSIIKTASQALEFSEELNNLDSKQKKKYFKTIEENIDFMVNTSDDFRNFLAPNKSKSTFDIHDCIEKVLKILFFKYNKNNIIIENKVEKELLLYGYKSEFSQVILNIVNNALDAHLENLTIKNRLITISSYLTNRYLSIVVDDNAGGIPLEIIDKIFEERFTTKNNKGSGIGLNISKRIIKNGFKGDIFVENNQDGASFEIKIPRN